MHIPDGMLTPSTYIPATVVASGLWMIATRKLKKNLDVQSLPSLAAMSGLIFLFSLISIPVPGGTVVHASGVPLFALCFGLMEAYLALSVVLLIQALYFGLGGVTSLGFNAIVQGFVVAAVARSLHGMIPIHYRDISLFVSVFFSILVSSIIVALVLGLQPIIGSDGAGNPLYFPFGWDVTLPAVVLPNFWMAVGEATLTVGSIRYFRRIGLGLPAMQR